MLAVIDCAGTNLTSVMAALERLGAEPVLTSDPDVVKKADKVILPGVGAAKAGMKALNQAGLSEILPTLKQPVLGICLGMQLLFEKSAEGDVDCLGIIPGDICQMHPHKHASVPHMGWNRLSLPDTRSSLLNGINNSDYVYFVHSYYAPTNCALATSIHGPVEFGAVVQKDNFYGCQFHPERSGKVGARILKNFLDLTN